MEAQHKVRVQQLLEGADQLIVHQGGGMFKVHSLASNRSYATCVADASCSCGRIQHDSSACHHLEAASRRLDSLIADGQEADAKVRVRGVLGPWGSQQLSPRV